MSVGGWGVVVGTLASELLRPCSLGVGVKWTSLLIGEKLAGDSVLLSFHFEAGLVTASSLGTVETFLEG